VDLADDIRGYRLAWKVEAVDPDIRHVTLQHDDLHAEVWVRPRKTPWWRVWTDQTGLLVDIEPDCCTPSRLQINVTYGASSFHDACWHAMAYIVEILNERAQRAAAALDALPKE